jgi:hypothetical protein
MPSVCLGVSEARAWVHVAHAVEYRIFLCWDRPCLHRPVAVGIGDRGRHYLDYTDPTPRSLATCHRPPLLARTMIPCRYEPRRF